jgi:NAD(P)-dependent dehydrogenase (short-subunit alcohol dehydrogenase family)
LGFKLTLTRNGAFLFSQAVLPLLLKGLEQNPKYPPTLIFTGATASVKANAMMSAFNTGKYAQRALSSSLAKEFGPKGIHVSHAIIDGVIDIPRTKEWMKDAGPDAKISADGIADAYWHLHTQPRSTFTWEIDVRPSVEKW